jgi:hypothetical protein
VQTADDGGILCGDAVLVELGAIGGGDAGCVEEIFAAPGDAVQRAAVVAGGDLAIGLAGLIERDLGRGGDDAAQGGVVVRDAVEIDPGQALGGDLFCGDPMGEMGERGEGDLGIGGGEGHGLQPRADGCGACSFGAGRGAGNEGTPTGVGGDAVGDRYLVGAYAACVKLGHGLAPVACGLGAVLVGERKLDQLFRFGEGCHTDLGTSGWGGAKGGWCAGCGAVGWRPGLGVGVGCRSECGGPHHH